jgi:hypothetical protein
MKEAQGGPGKRASRRQTNCGGDISREHVGPLDIGQGLIEGEGDGFFHKALLQADAQLARQNLYEVFGFTGPGTPEQLLE